MALTVLDSLEFDSVHGTYPDIVHVSGNVYAIAYSRLNEPRPGYVKTVSIDNAGNIGSIIDTLEFDSGGGVSPSIIHISGNIYAIVYQGPDTDGWLVTVEISTAGAITDTIVDSYEFDSVRGCSTHILHISGTTYAIAYAGPDDDGWLKTLTIANDGSIAVDPSLDSLEFSTSCFSGCNIIHISGDIYVIAHSGYDATTKYDLRIVTVDIDGAGAIEDAIVDSLQILAPCSPDLCVVGVGRITHVAGNTYAVVWKADSAERQKKIILSTFEISTAGAIGAAAIDQSEVALGDYTPDLIQLTSDHYAVAYSGLGSDGFLKTITIEADGTIGAVTGTLEFDTSRCGSAPYILSTTEDILAIAYEGPDYDGWLKTIGDIETPAVTTDPATGLGQPMVATLNGTLDDDGGIACECGFEYGETGAYGTTTPTESKNTGETFSQAITGLSPGTVYHFRAIAENGAGTSYGSDRIFRTRGQYQGNPNIDQRMFQHVERMER